MMGDFDHIRPKKWRESLGVCKQVDALYPVPEIDARVDTLRFHVQVWDMGRDDREEVPSVDMLYVPSVHAVRDGVSTPMFYSRSGRARFRRWWTTYARLFDVNPENSYLPVLRSGRVSGVVIEDGHVMGDAVLHTLADGNTISEGWSLVNMDCYHMLSNIAPHWAWIAANCKGRVWRVHQGWMFQRGVDAVKFQMCRDTIELG